MSSKDKVNDSLEPGAYLLWSAEEGRTVEAGAERRTISLPSVPLPLHREDMADGGPSDDAIGRGVYDYLRQFPDCPFNVPYAELLRDAYPHYLAELGAHIVMLEHKEVDAPYVRRKIAYMKILALLDGDNGGLQQRLGIACYELGLIFSELRGCRSHLLAAMGHLQRSLKLLPGDMTTLNLLGQVDFMLGDYPSAARRWRAVADALEESPARQALAAKVARIEEQRVPDHPLVDDLEAIGEAMERYGEGDVTAAGTILNRLDEEGTVAAEFPAPEFYYLLGICRERGEDPGGAFAAYEEAIRLDPDYAPALEGKDRILEGRRL